jgi:hypothetical protein
VAYDLCPVCQAPLISDPADPVGIDVDGHEWPTRECLEHGLFGRRDDGVLVPVAAPE